MRLSVCFLIQRKAYSALKTYSESDGERQGKDVKSKITDGRLGKRRENFEKILIATLKDSGSET